MSKNSFYNRLKINQSKNTHHIESARQKMNAKKWEMFAEKALKNS